MCSSVVLSLIAWKELVARMLERWGDVLERLGTA